MSVSARGVAFVAGLVAAVYLFALFSFQRVPDWALDAIGGPRGVARDGGLVIRYRPPAAYDAAKLERRAASRGLVLRREADVLVLEVPGVAQAEATPLAAMLTQGGLELREVLEDKSLVDYAERTDGGRIAPGVEASIDQWDGKGPLRARTRAYLHSDDAAKLDAAITALRARGWAQPPHSVIGYQRIVVRRGDDAPRAEWRAHVLGDAVLLDGDSVESARVVFDPSRGGPAMRIELDRDSGDRFGEITAWIVPHKLAILVSGRVRWMPAIDQPIRDGLVMFSIGGDDGALNEQALLATALGAVALPPGGVLEHQTWTAPADVIRLLVLARALIGLAGGAGIGLLIWIVLRVARPTWQSPSQPSASALPFSRVAMTLLAPAALLVLGAIPWPGFHIKPILELMQVGLPEIPTPSIADLGVGPIVTAFMLTEMATLLRARWRRMRLTPIGRLTIERWGTGLGIALALLQSHLIVAYWARIDATGAYVPGSLTHVAGVVSLTSGTMMLTIVAGMIRAHGLGNGYVAVIVSGWAIEVVRRLFERPSLGFALGVIAFSAVACATVAVLRMRIGGAREAPLRVPSAGRVPLTSAGVAVALWSFTKFGMDSIDFEQRSNGWWRDVEGAGWYLLAALLVVVPIWSFVFSRPALIAPLAAHTSLAPPSRASWGRATLLSLAFLLAVTAVSLGAAIAEVDAVLLSDAAMAMLAAALLLDVYDELDARRTRLVAVWSIQSPQHAELVHRVLVDAGITCHLRSSHVRTLLAFFGSFAPIDVLVAPAAADDAHARIEAMFHGVR